VGRAKCRRNSPELRDLGARRRFQARAGRSLEDLSNDWRDAVQTTFLPQLGDHYARAGSRSPRSPSGTLRGGRIFLAPASRLTAGHRVLRRSGGFFIDLWLADAETGRVKRRLVKSTQNNNYESLRFINSAGAFSPTAAISRSPQAQGPR